MASGIDLTCAISTIAHVVMKEICRLEGLVSETISPVDPTATQKIWYGTFW